MILRTREPDIDKFLNVLKGGKMDRVHLFELFMDPPVYEFFADRKFTYKDSVEDLKVKILASYNAGYDYASTHGSGLYFPNGNKNHLKTISANEGGVIKNRADFEAYPWPNAKELDYSTLEKITPFLPKGMKLCVMGPCGVLENVTSLIGYEDLCIMSFEDPQLLEDIFNRVGQILLDYYTISCQYDSVAFIISNDDWGFNTQTFLSPAELRKYVFPWHKKIVEVAHKNGKPAVLHSCGYMLDVFDDIIDDMKFDGKHSYEDNILSVEDSYKRFSDRITVLGGLDLDFLIRNDAQTIADRCRKIIELSKDHSRYMLGSGNSLAYYIPIEKIIAMINVAQEYKF